MTASVVVGRAGVSDGFGAPEVANLPGREGQPDVSAYGTFATERGTGVVRSSTSPVGRTRLPSDRQGKGQTEAAPKAEASPSSRLNPPSVIRGEEKPANAAKVDWLNATFPAPEMTVEGFIALLARMFGRPVSGRDGGGMLGFEKSVRLTAFHGSESTPIGNIGLGGESQHGRWLFQLTGQGCQFVKDWSGLADLLELLDARLTRVDLAVDFYEGEYSVDDALSLHSCEGFTFPGKTAPKTALAGDWLGGFDGRTLYVGKAANGKMLRVYEKGRQLGDADSEWTRFEVVLGNRDRVLPFEVLTDCDAFFAGAYPALQELVEAAARAIPTSRPDALVTLAHLGHHLSRSYGKWFNAMSGHAKATYAELIEGVTVLSLPRRLDLSCVAAGVNAADVFARMKEKQ